MSTTYLRAYEDLDFLNRDELRAVRLQTELIKPDLIMDEELIQSTVCVFGSARTLSPTDARARLAAAQKAPAAEADSAAARQELKAAEQAVADSHYYAVAREFGALMSQFGQQTGALEYVIITGGGPGIMEAANRGAADVGAKSIGVNITLPHEQQSNPYISPDLNFLLHYFSIRKMHLLLRAKALCAFPGGFGTMDELFETLMLTQTGKTPRIPVILFGREYWDKLINWQLFLERGMISPADLELIDYCEDAQDAVDLIKAFHRPH